MGKSGKRLVGMDRHKKSIDVATGDERGGEVRHYRAIEKTLSSGVLMGFGPDYEGSGRL